MTAKWRIVAYGVALAGFSLLLSWLDYRHFARAFTTEIYIAIIAILFVALGIWIGNRLTNAPAPNDFAPNTKAIEYLGISARELEVLSQLAQGSSNKLIARALKISPNTVKTHILRIYEKLGANNRTEATKKARELQIIP